MKLVPRPQYDDEAALDALVANRRLASYQQLVAHVPALKAGYAQYLAENGNVSSITHIALPADTATFLRGHYSSPPKALAHIKEIRNNSAPDTCPMCGSMHSGTLDHVMDRDGHPAFSVFSPNLVPACKCNSVRLQRLIGDNEGERLLHPYFDTVLDQRIVVAHFTDLGPVPSIKTCVELDPADPNFAAARFHHRCVVERTSIVGYLRIRWNRLIQAPRVVVHDLQQDPASRPDLIVAIQDERNRTDIARGSKNNWDSVMLSGLLDDHVIDWLFERFSQPGRLPNAPLL